MLKRYAHVFFLVALSTSSWAQKIRTIVPRQPVVVGNAFQLQYIITDPVGFTDLVPPVFDSLRLVSGPNHYKGNATVNGKTQAIENITYTVVASRPGSLRLKSAVASFRNGPEERSEEAVIQVLPHPRASFSARSSYTDPALYTPSSKTDLEKLIAENLFIRTEVNKTSVFIGEAIVATFKLYSRLQSTSEVLNAPGLYGFSVVDILNINEAHQSVESVNGKVFNTSILRKLQLYPERSGYLVIDEMPLKNEVEFIDSITDSKSVVERILVSQPVKIFVKPLPANKPEPFTGAVGQFTMEAFLDRPVIEEMQQGKLTIRIKGKGNFIQFGQPVIHWPARFDVFDPELRDRITNQVAPTEGTREYIFGFSTDSSGQYFFPPVLFSFYDPVSEEFRTVKTDSLELKVREGKQRENARIINSKEEPGNIIWIILTAALLTIVAFFVYRFRKNNDSSTILKAPEKMKFSELVYKLDTESMSEKNTCLQIRKILTEARNEYAAISNESVSEWEDIQKECQVLVYSGLDDSVKKAELKQRAYRLLKELEENKGNRLSS